MEVKNKRCYTSGITLVLVGNLEKLTRQGLRFVQNPVNANELCCPTKFSIPNSIEILKLPIDFISIKSVSHTQTSILAKIHEIAWNKARKTQNPHGMCF